MLISWASTPTQIRKRIGSITFHVCVCVWGGGGGDSASYFIEMSIVIICVGTLTQIRMGLGCITFPGIGPRRGQYAFIMLKSRILIHIVLGFQP